MDLPRATASTSKQEKLSYHSQTQQQEADMNDSVDQFQNVSYGSITFEPIGHVNLMDSPYLRRHNLGASEDIEPHFKLINKDGTINRRRSLTGCLNHSGANHGPKHTSGCLGFCNRFRYIICGIVLMAVLIHNYINTTLYIAAIRMVSGDVLESGLTALRAIHIERNPLAVTRDAASPGTCPIQLEPTAEMKGLMAQAINSVMTNDTTHMVNLTQVSVDAYNSMTQNAQTLISDVKAAVASGELVDWDINEKSLIFSAHTIGGIVFAIPISHMGLRYGNKLPITLCMVTCTLRALLLPAIVGHCSFWLVFAFEFAFGAPGQMIAVVYLPLIASWMVTSEANLTIGLITLANLLGDSLTNFLSGQLLAMGIEWSWCFYGPGIAFAILTVAWLWLGADEPQASSYVSLEESTILDESVTNIKRRREAEEMRLLDFEQSTRCACSDINCPARFCKRIPNWKQIITCRTIWTLVGVAFAAHWNSKATNMWPSYFANILHLSTETVGFLIGIRGFVVIFVGLSISYFTRHFTIDRPFDMSLTAYRKWGQLFALISLTISIGSMTIFDCDVVANTVGIMLTPLVSSFNSISVSQMIFDLSAEDSGLIHSYLRLVGIGDVLVLPVSSYILSYAQDQVVGDRYTWRLVWLVGLAIKFVSCFFFFVYAQTHTGRQYSHLGPKGKCRALRRSSKK